MGDGFEKASNKKSCSASDDDDDDVYDDGSAPDVTGAECTDIIPDCAVCFRRRGRTFCRRCEAGFEKARNKKSCSASAKPAPSPCNVLNCARCGKKRKSRLSCMSCDDGYTLSKNKKLCSAVEKPAPVVQPPVVEPAVVDEDDDDAGVTGKLCRVKNCAVCKTEGIKCKICAEGFKKAKDNKNCTPKTAAPSPCNVLNCARCGTKKKSRSKCMACDDGYTLSKSKKLCSAGIEPEPVVEPPVIDNGDDDDEDFDDDGS